MKINVELENGFLPEKYAKHTAAEFMRKGSPIVSFPIKLDNVPESTRAIALTFVDYDSIPVCGFAWIHWTALIPQKVTELPENASQLQSFGMIQGANSLASNFVGERDKNVTERYSGPTPPDKNHDYTLNVYALDCVPDLTEGFFMNELLKAVNGHTLAKAKAVLPARS